MDAHPLAVDLGEWVIDQALTQMSLWQAQGLILPVSVNIGARQLQQAHFVGRLREILDSHAEVDPEHLELEILETSALEDLAEVAQVIAACRAMGVKFALDDFGNRLFLATTLSTAKVARLKIDQSFVRDMLDDPDDLAILSGVIGLAAAFRRDVIAEGVETAEHGAMLLQLGCEEAQGYALPGPCRPASCRLGRPLAGDPNWRNLPALNRDDLPLLFARTELRAWMTAVTLYLRGERASAPTLDEAHSRFAHWLANEGAHIGMAPSPVHSPFARSTPSCMPRPSRVPSQRAAPPWRTGATASAGARWCWPPCASWRAMYSRAQPPVTPVAKRWAIQQNWWRNEPGLRASKSQPARQSARWAAR